MIFQLRDIITYTDSINAEIVEKKVKEVIRSGRDFKSTISLTDYEYREFTRHIRRKTNKGINDMKREVKLETSGIG